MLGLCALYFTLRVRISHKELQQRENKTQFFTGYPYNDRQGQPSVISQGGYQHHEQQTNWKNEPIYEEPTYEEPIPAQHVVRRSLCFGMSNVTSEQIINVFK